MPKSIRCGVAWWGLVRCGTARLGSACWPVGHGAVGRVVALRGGVICRAVVQVPKGEWACGRMRGLELGTA